MPENREQFAYGSSHLTDFYYWMNERHSIYLRRLAGQTKPWTTDVILQKYKFTNVFRELDRGTIALRKMEEPTVENWERALTDAVKEDIDDVSIQDMAGSIVFNTFWYRFYNLDVNATRCGMCDWPKLLAYITSCVDSNKQVFTGAHIVRGIGNSVSGALNSFKHFDQLPVRIQRGIGVMKAFDYLALSFEIWNDRFVLAQKFRQCSTLQQAFNVIREYFLLGDFTSYEIVCDLRWTVLKHCTDILTWGNVGNGAERGMKRLGMEPTVESMQALWFKAPEYLSEALQKHHIGFVVPSAMPRDEYPSSWKLSLPYPPFEIREVEHSLCEFDKYMRVKTGLGTPRSGYNGGA